MPETPKEKNEKDKKSVKDARENEAQDEGAWSRDQREKGYYYDDNYGYEIYNPDADDDEDED